MRSCPRCRRAFVDTQDVCPLDDVRLEARTSGTLPPGVDRVLGSYRLIALLGEGGMGNVYIGAHTRLNRYVAIKVLRPELQHDTAAIARFFDEARTINRIKHPNIIESIDVVDDGAEGAHCVLELLRGLDLRARLDAGRIPIESALRIGAQIADALDAVHAADIVHRDLKPQNLMLLERGGHDDFVKLLDFGVAQTGATGATGVPFGTAAYMAPEQAAGERVDGRADSYALGVLLFEMVTGQHPFPSNNDHEYLLRHADDAPPRPSKLAPAAHIPQALDDVILRCLAKQPGARFASAIDVAAALRSIKVRPKRHRRAWASTTALRVLVLAGGGVAGALVVPDLLRDPAPSTATPRVPTRVRPVAAITPDAAVPPRMASIAFESTPAGARVFRTGETIPLGTTPFATTLPRSDRPTALRFELAGHEPLEVEAHVGADARVAPTLVPVPPRAPDGLQRLPDSRKPLPKPKQPAGVQREGVMDPFAPIN